MPTDFEFIKKLDEPSYCKEWLRITPYSGTINPGNLNANLFNIKSIQIVGEKCDIRLEVNLETDLDKIDDILILHLKGGKDMFIIVSGKCQKSCFTSSMSTLCRTPVPLLHLTTDQWKQAVGDYVSKLSRL